MTILISTINFRIFIINSSFNLLILSYILHDNYFITILVIIYLFIISFRFLLQNTAEYRQIKDWACSSCSSPPTLPTTQPFPPSIPIHAVDRNPFTIMQFNANGIGNKLA